MKGAAGNSKLEEKVTQLLQWSTKAPLIKLSSEKFNYFARTKPKNYSIVAMFTALKPQRRCTICQEAKGEFDIVANSYRVSSEFSSKLFFVMIDIDEGGAEAFQALRLTSAPTYFHFPGTGKRQPEDSFSASRFGISAEALAKWVAERTDVHFTIVRPPNYTAMMIWLVAVLLGLIIAYWNRENLSTLFDPTKWAILAMGLVFIMISGQMWNVIRGPPFSHRNPQTGEAGYFSGTGQYQFIAETYIVLGLYAAMSLGVVLINRDTTLPLSPSAEKVTLIIGLILLVGVFSFLLSIFKMKYHGYPYRLFFG
jgi:oligosaccharyltransferase complex subunit gamma